MSEEDSLNDSNFVKPAARVVTFLIMCGIQGSDNSHSIYSKIYSRVRDKQGDDASINNQYIFDKNSVQLRSSFNDCVCTLHCDPSVNIIDDFGIITDSLPLGRVFIEYNWDTSTFLDDESHDDQYDQGVSESRSIASSNAGPPSSVSVPVVAGKKADLRRNSAPGCLVNPVGHPSLKLDQVKTDLMRSKNSLIDCISDVFDDFGIWDIVAYKTRGCNFFPAVNKKKSNEKKKRSFIDGLYKEIDSGLDKFNSKPDGYDSGTSEPGGVSSSTHLHPVIDYNDI